MNSTAAVALDLRDIHAAAAPTFWPPAPGWWLLAVVLLALLVVLTLWALQRYRAYQQQRQIMNELDRLNDCYSKDNISAYITEISTLLRRVALRRYARTRVASLTGPDWLRFLDDTGGDGGFEKGVGQVLEVGPYQSRSSDVPVEALLVLVRRWVKKNLEVAA